MAGAGILFISVLGKHADNHEMGDVKIGITLGDPAGIGPEIAAKAIASGRFRQEGLVLFGDSRNFRETASECNLDSSLFSGLAFVEIPSPPITRGRVSAESGRVALSSIEAATKMAMEGKIDGICTAPISKEAISLAGSSFIDHTVMLEQLTSSRDVTTVFETGKLRIIFLTKHLPLRDALNDVRREKILRYIALADSALRSLGSERRRIAVAALNPHSGENGLLGDEEIREIGPAVEDAKHTYDVHGPIPADSVFHQASEGEFDIVLSMYHDQGHIAAKTMDFGRTVSMNIGLPFLRTSVDHGTAFDIAGRCVADETSMVEAIDKCLRYSIQYRKNRESVTSSE